MAKPNVLIPELLKGDWGIYMIGWPYDPQYRSGLWYDLTFEIQVDIKELISDRNRSRKVFGSMSQFHKWYHLNNKIRGGTEKIFFFQFGGGKVFHARAILIGGSWAIVGSPESMPNRWHRFTVQFRDDAAAAKWMGREYTRMMERFI